MRRPSPTIVVPIPTGVAEPGTGINADSVVAPITSATFPPSDAFTASSLETPFCSETITHDGSSALTNGRSARIVSVARTNTNRTCEANRSRADDEIATLRRAPSSASAKPRSRTAATTSGRISSIETSCSRASRYPKSVPSAPAPIMPIRMPINTRGSRAFPQRGSEKIRSRARRN